MKKIYQFFLPAILILIIFSIQFQGCSDDEIINPNPTSGDLTNTYTSQVAFDWYNLQLRLIKQTSGLTPPVSSRALGYTGLVLYESVLPGMPDYKSLSGQLNGMPAMPQINSSESYHWPTSANAALAYITRKMYFNATSQNLASIDSMETANNTLYQSSVSSDIFERSKNFGISIASAIYDYAVTDGGNEGQLHNTDPTYVPPVGPGLWVPTAPGFAQALQPHWGDNRPFLTANVIGCQPDSHPVYSESNTSLFYSQALEVYTVFTKLTQEEKDIALFWADGGGTYTPPGHSVSILIQVLKEKNSMLDVAAIGLAKVGIAVNDAFISCWKAKFNFNLLRPITYIRNLINPAWSPFIATPPFPEYTSGHSVQSGATAQILSDMFGYNYAFTDNSHSDLGYAARSFNSFFEFASEAAISRLYGGIHYRAAIEKGVFQGSQIGLNIRALQFQR